MTQWTVERATSHLSCAKVELCKEPQDKLQEAFSPHLPRVEEELLEAVCFGTLSTIIDIQKTTVEEPREGLLKAEAQEGGAWSPS